MVVFRSPAGRGSCGEHTRLACGFRRLAGIIQRQLTARALGGAPKAARGGACAPQRTTILLPLKPRQRLTPQHCISPAGRGRCSVRGSVGECGSLHRFFLEVFSFKLSVFSSSKPCPSMFPFLQPLIRPRKAAGTAALQGAPAPPTRCLAKPGVGTAVPSRPRLSRRAGDSTPHLPVDSFSLREKVAAGRMRVKTLGCFFVNAMFSPSPLPSPRRGRCSVRGSVGECGSLHPFFWKFSVSSFQFLVLQNPVHPCFHFYSP